MNKRKSEAENDNDESQKPKKSSKAIHPFFISSSSSQAQQTSASSFVWLKSISKTCLHGTNLNPRQSPKVAAFDLDGVLIKTKGDHAYPKDRNDWMWWRPLVKDKLIELDEEGYTIVIFSNQASTKPKVIEEWKNKVPLFAKELPNTPFRIFAAQGHDWYRKPMPGMWLEFEKVNDVTVDLASSFFVGDAAGRAGDHSDSDRKFALNIGLPFFTPEEYFLNKPPIPFKLSGFDIKGWSMDQPLFLPTSTPLVPLSGSGNPSSSKEVVLFVGYPASGKTTFFKRYFEPMGYKHVNQDTLKTRSKCLKTVETFLEAGESCVVDNTNRDIETRKEYIDLCKKYNVPIRCIYFTAPLALSWHNNLYRTYSQRIEPSVVTSSTLIEEAKTVTTVSEDVASGATVASTSRSRVKKKEVKATTAMSSKNTIKVAEPLPPFAFISYRSRFEEPTIEEGFSEIKRVNFIFDDSDSPPANEITKSETVGRKNLWTKRRIWEMWLEVDKLGWMSQ